HSRFDRLREGMRSRQVGGPDIRGKTVTDAVGQLERLLIGVEGGDGHDRTEDHLLEDPHIRSDIGEDSRGDVVALGKVLLPAYAGEEPAFALADLDVAHDLVVVLRVNERADLGPGVVRVADDDVLRPRGIPFEELVVDGPLDEDPAAGGAALAVEREDTEQG